MMARVLVVEDSPTQAAEAAFVLEDAGFDVEIAADGIEGYECVKEGDFDLVLSDVIMPGMSGFELCRKAKEELPDTSVFLFTTLNRTVDILRGLECGADGYVNKPYEPDVLVDRINDFLFLKAQRAGVGSRRETEAVVDGQRFSLPEVPEHVLDYVVSVIAHCARERETAGNGAQRSAEALRRSEERFALSVSGANDGLWDWDIQANQIYFSPRWKAILGYADNEVELELDGWRSRVHPEDRDSFSCDLAAHLEGSLPHFESEHRLQHKDGTWRWVLARGVCLRDADGKPTRMAGSLTDTTERKRTEENLLTVRAELTAILAAVPDRCFLLGEDGVVVDCHGGRDAAGGPVGGAGAAFADLLPDETREAALAALAQARETGTLASLEYRQASADGERVYELRLSPLTQGQVLAMVRDITARKREEIALRLTQFSVDGASEGIAWFARDGRFLYANDAVARVLGQPAGELQKRTVHDVSPETTPAAWSELWERARRDGSVVAAAHHRRQDGRTLRIDFKASVLELDGREYLCAFARNLHDDPAHSAGSALQAAETDNVH